jgi:hypothetical protein
MEAHAWTSNPLLWELIQVLKPQWVESGDEVVSTSQVLKMNRRGSEYEVSIYHGHLLLLSSN